MSCQLPLDFFFKLINENFINSKLYWKWRNTQLFFQNWTSWKYHWLWKPLPYERSFSFRVERFLFDIPIWSLYVFITVCVITTMIISYCRLKYWVNKFSYVNKNRTLAVSKIGFSWHEEFHYTLGIQIANQWVLIVRKIAGRVRLSRLSISHFANILPFDAEMVFHHFSCFPFLQFWMNLLPKYVWFCFDGLEVLAKGLKRLI